MPNVLVVTSSMRMLNWVHSHTTNLRPAIPLHPKFVVCVTSLKKRLFSSPSTRNLSNHRPTPTWHNLLSTRRKLDPAIKIQNKFKSLHSFPNNKLPLRYSLGCKIQSTSVNVKGTNRKHAQDHRGTSEAKQ
ncbi:hypothetical protein CR513_54087, partial [Mucuna pruriens]